MPPTYRALLATAFAGLLTVLLLPATYAAATGPDDTFTTPATKPLQVPAPGVLTNDTKPPAQHSLVVTTPPMHADGFALAADGSFVYVPPADSLGGTDGFTYCVGTPAQADGGCATPPRKVRIVIVGTTAVADDYDAFAATRLEVPAPGVRANDTPHPGTSVTAVEPPARAADFRLRPDGSLRYRPATGFSGGDTFSYCVVAKHTTEPCLSTPVEVQIDVAQPKANADRYAVPTDGTLELAAPGLLGNDVNRPPGSSWTVLTEPTHGSWVVGEDGHFSYTPDKRYAGSDALTYCLTVDFWDGACFAPPAAVAFTVGKVAVADDQFAAFPGVAAYQDAPGALRNDVGVPSDAGMSVRRAPAHAAMFSSKRDGSFGYESAPDFAGPDSFTYCLTADATPTGACVSPTATVTIEVAKAEVAPQSYTTSAVTPLDVGAPGLLTAAGSDLRPVVTVPAAHAAELSLAADGSFRFVPAAGFVGTDRFSFCLTLASGFAGDSCVSEPAVVSVTVLAPVATDDLVTWPGSEPALTLPAPAVLGNDLRVAPTASFLLINPPKHVTVAAAGQSLTFLAADAAGAKPFFGLTDVDYCVTAVANVGPCLSNPATITFDSNLPAPADDLIRVTPGTTTATVAPGVLDNDEHVPDGGWPQVLDAPEHAESFVLAPDGSFSYQPAAGFTGVDSFTYCVAMPAVAQCPDDSPMTASVAVLVGASGRPDDSPAVSGGDDPDPPTTAPAPPPTSVPGPAPAPTPAPGPVEPPAPEPFAPITEPATPAAAPAPVEAAPAPVEAEAVAAAPVTPKGLAPTLADESSLSSRQSTVAVVGADPSATTGRNLVGLVTWAAAMLLVGALLVVAITRRHRRA